MLKKFTLLAICAITVASPQLLLAHCEVPCGIYGDQRRFEQMLEDQQTVAKAIAGVVEMAGKTDPKSVNQTARWIMNKESHATSIQHTISQYFMTQRIKADGDNYTKKLTAAHAVMVAAMKCKQDASPATADALRESILDFYRAYEGKEPQLGRTDHVHSDIAALPKLSTPAPRLISP